MGLLDALLTVVVISIVCYIIIMLYRKASTAPRVPGRRDQPVPGTSSFDDKMTDDQVKAFHRLVTSSPEGDGGKATAAV
ncbi:ORF089 virion membrane protein [Bovine papular stomatitis virus]|uniref:Virion membrane protein n=1 Tax=Bovine papular stomatitis virus TaxID=129727 RepID=Q6TV99_9POXV|nr:ORF089 virion membrane protein [Bovine papular stomatitis virus]AAR98446.1 ORF089 virion membrane protein [Bovine papular stomatitis virus]AKC03258.1 virion membrane protein [Bovine papular stomatitis virus]AKC03387.1 virion membrane protein [Bovine papular stomatitis virus]AKC03515.1 virion membrane protein [Bovine papular stomatitis virus]